MAPEIWSATDRVFCHSGPFFALLPPYGPRKSKFWKDKKSTTGYYHFTNVYHKRQSYDVSYLRYGVQQTEFVVILDHFLPFYSPQQPEKSKFWKNAKNTWKYYYFTQVYHKWQSYDVWFLRYEAWRTEFFVILDRFLTFYPPNNPKNQNFEKMKKTPGNIIILRMCTINDNHMMCGSWDIEGDGQISLSFWTIFCPFTHLKTRKIKIF